MPQSHSQTDSQSAAKVALKPRNPLGTEPVGSLLLKFAC